MSQRGQLDRRTIRDHRGHHPWRVMGMLPTWRVDFTWDLPVNVRGMTLHDERRVLVRNGLTCAERRSTIAHEAGHVLRGPVGRRCQLAEESLVERQAARLLIPSVRRVGHALAWHHADHERAAADLWVDEQLLHARISTLSPTERTWLDDQLATILI